MFNTWICDVCRIVYSIYIYHLIRYSITCGFCHNFLDRGFLLSINLLNQGFLVVKLKSSLRKFYGWHHDLVNRYRISLSRMTTYMFRFVPTNTSLPHSWLFIGFVTRVAQLLSLVEQRLPPLSGTPEFTPVFVGFVLLKPP